MFLDRLANINSTMGGDCGATTNRKAVNYDIHVLETTAYTRLKEQGLCERGIVPDFLGSMRKFDLTLLHVNLT